MKSLLAKTRQARAIVIVSGAVVMVVVSVILLCILIQAESGPERPQVTNWKIAKLKCGDVIVGVDGTIVFQGGTVILNLKSGSDECQNAIDQVTYRLYRLDRPDVTIRYGERTAQWRWEGGVAVAQFRNLFPSLLDGSGPGSAEVFQTGVYGLDVGIYHKDHKVATVDRLEFLVEPPQRNY